MKIDIINNTISHKNEVYSFDDILRELHPLKDDIVYLAGSIIEGAIAPCAEKMGNDLSDIDVFIIRKHSDYETTTSEYAEKMKKIYFLNNVLNGLDVEVFDYDYVEWLSNIVDDSMITPNERTSTLFSSKGEENSSFTKINAFLCRLKYSICIYNYEKYNEIVQNINFNHFSSLYIHHLVTRVDNILPDIYGNIEVQQYDVALYCMREVFIYIMRIILLREGVFVDRPKWIPLKFKNMVKVKTGYLKVWNVYSDLFIKDISDGKTCEVVLHEGLECAKQEIEYILLGGISLI